MIRLADLLLAALLALGAEPQPRLSGDLRTHDPSVIEIDGRFLAFGTGAQGLHRGAVEVKISRDGLSWTDAGAIGKGVPAWGKAALGYQPTNVWAPSISRRGATAYLYYALSSFGSNASAIGLMTNPTLGPARPTEGWKDGPVLMSQPSDDFNAIDPYRIDLEDGRAFLAYGSFWSGIKLRQLDPASGKLLSEDTRTYALASRHDGAVEAAAILPHARRFYLFVSFDQCCKGVDSTYKMRVGRATRIEGPYFDREGRDMREGGGSLLLGASGRFLGPGGQEPVRTSHDEKLAFHYYDADAAGASKLQVSPLGWDSDGWPELGPWPP